jgi:hypothetical protein
MKFFAVFFVLLALVVSGAWSQTTASTDFLRLQPGDLRVEAFPDGYHLIIRQKPGLESVMLAEAFEPQGHRLATYSYRALAPNAVNGNEQRLLNGKFLPPPHTDLISSTPVSDPQFGQAFVILVPPVIEYGYKDTPGARWGRVNVQNRLLDPHQSLWFSVRTFSKPYGDYTGLYRDNAFEMKELVAKISAPPVSGGDSDVALLRRLGPVYQAEDARDGIHKIQGWLQDDLDMVICIDTTKSMADYLKTIQEKLLPSIEQSTKGFKHLRVGLVFYRDYMEEYLTKTMSFQSDLSVVQEELDRAVATGGGDIPEAVVEGIWSALNAFDWKAAHRLVLVIGDAPQHDIPRGKITEAMMHEKALDENVEIQIVKLPPGGPN